MYILPLLIVAGLVGNSFSELRGQCPPVLDWEKCEGVPANNCTSDEDCGHQTKCCATACGRGCVKPLFTECQQAQMNAIHRARMLNPSDPPARIPLCNEVGDYEPIQCDPVRQLCWCVDDGGLEIPGTRAPNRDLVNCSEPRPCASHMCRMFCPFGFATDPSGCPRCECYDPCSEIRCPNSLTCQLEDVPCLGDVCNPLPRCKKGRSLENICPYGRPLEIAGTRRPFLCGSTPEKPQCPPLYECGVQPNSEYGVCCPASFKLQKPGTCAVQDDDGICGFKCVHDLECPMMQKCCESDHCGKHCSQPQNVTVCLQQKMLTELLIVNEKEGKGYVPQCSPESGQFEPRQCSRNGLVCWCVNSNGDKLPGTMGSGDKVQCSKVEKVKATGRSAQSDCDLNICAQMCEYGFKVGANGCPTCECDNPCDGFPCDDDKECVIMKDSSCSGTFCSSYPVCQSKQISSDPLKTCEGENCQTMEKSELDDEESKVLEECPSATILSCNSVVNCRSDNDCDDSETCCRSSECGSICVGKNIENNDEPRPQSMCEYLRDFSEKMEGTREGMSIALPPPQCNLDGTYKAMQCWNNECWCVDEFGTEIPRSRGNGTNRGCQSLREELSCLGLTCRLGCDFGFVMDQETRCPLCECRNPCDSISCGPEMECLMVDVNCEDEYCSPVPACLPKKIGQCPYLIPMNSGSCEFECKVDSNCNGTEKCCSNGCGTQCTEPVLMTACQHHRSIMQHMAHEAGIPARQMYMPACRASDGGYEEVQCHPGLNQCWCVSESGEEIPETRVASSTKLSCSVTPKCPLKKCEPCAHGYQIDSDGCRTCTCRDPCTEIACRGEGEACRMVKVNCISEPCPEVAMCLPRKDNPCMSGQPLVQEGTDSPVKCGPRDFACPSSHKCHLSPLDEYSVCCPKPRDVCFEPLNEGGCNTTVETRWRFSPEKNKCEEFTYYGCGGNQNNFNSENICRAVCPVLTQCERLREKNQKAAEKYKKSTFIPRCDAYDGSWEPVQCLEAVGVCWCVNSLGHPVKGSLVRSDSPNCSSRQARRRMFSEEPEIVIEDFLKEVLLQPVEEEASSKEDLSEQPAKTRCQVLQETITAYSVKCDEEGRFIPTQCFNDTSECWCIDEAGNQLPNSKTFKWGTKFCMPTPIKEVDVTLGFHYNSLNIKKKSIETQIKNIMERAGASILNNEMTIKINPDVIYVNFILIGSNKVDVSYNLEQQVKEGKLSLELGPGNHVIADITSSRFSHHLQEKETGKLTFTEHVITLEQREIVSESAVSVVTPYQTAIIVLTVSSAFIICVLVIVILLYRRKMSSKYDSSSLKCQAMDQRFLPSSQSIYVVSFPAKSAAKVHSPSKQDNLTDDNNTVQVSSVSSQVVENKSEHCLL